jgi:hypothetical protein
LLTDLNAGSRRKPVRIAPTGPQILALPVSPDPNKPAPKRATEQLSTGKVVWASPAIGRALGGSALGNLHGRATLEPVLAPDSTVRHLVQFLDVAGDPLDDALTLSVQRGELSAAGGKWFKATIAGVGIILELAHPSDKRKLEKALSLSLNALVVLDPVTDLVPVLAHARPYLAGLIEVGGQLQAAVHFSENDAQKLP